MLTVTEDQSSLLRRIVSSLTERVATQNSPYSLKKSPDCPVFFHGLDHVIATRRPKPALPAEKRAQRELIKPHQGDNRRRGKPDYRFAQRHKRSPGLVLEILPLTSHL